MEGLSYRQLGTALVQHKAVCFEASELCFCNYRICYMTPWPAFLDGALALSGGDVTDTVTMLQGELEITTEAGSGKAKEPNAAGQVADVVDKVPFLFLGLDLPAAPLYKDVMETNIIPQVG